jgi:hypothetical protein
VPDNLKNVLESATPRDWEMGRSAYPRYHRLTRDIAARHGFGPEVGAGVFAALSPNNGYLGNLRDVDRVLEAVRLDLGPKSVRVSTYGLNKIKAWRIALGEPPLRVLSGTKVRSFYTNIIDPHNRLVVTVDGHMLNAWRGERFPLTARGPNGRRTKMSEALYREVAQEVRTLARDRGELPSTVQAVIWFAWRRHIGLANGQLEMWHRDYEAAGLGFVYD